MSDDIFWDITNDHRFSSSDSEEEEEEGVTQGSEVHWELSSLPSNEETVVGIQEMRGDGVLDNVGGELWEASLLLCAYMLSHRDKFLHASVLELGAGVGLCGLLALQMKRRALHALQTAPSTSDTPVTCAKFPGEVCFSDNDPQVLTNLCSAVRSLKVTEAAGQLQLQAEPDAHKARTASDVANAIPVSVVHLDWSKELPPGLLGRFDLAIGSALCYSVGHSAALRSTIRSLLLGQGPPSTADAPICASTGSDLDSPGPKTPRSPSPSNGPAQSPDSCRHRCRCKEIVIVQIQDRSGFQSLLQALGEDSALRVCVQSISQEMYSFVQQISTSSCSQQQRQTHAQTQAQGQVTLQKKYHIPVWAASGNSPPLPLPLPSPSPLPLPLPLPKGHRRGLLTSSRDSFVIVSVTARVS